ncbi:trypsin, alkaline C-like [Bicyclus anynana]|uniref:Trypsin, alkaline C-like n=1 Tax=Bicyclus anynana TaxID=110368 RepID=A0A6J1MVK7_BICAN|nr:trypsin, alkaline C-like [Bicyclus anynana]
MVAIFILCLALFTGATTALDFDQVDLALNGTTNVTTLQQFPSVVQVEFLNIWGWEVWTQNCAASILTSWWILSATTCFFGPSYPDPYARRIRAGANNRNTGGQIIYVDFPVHYQQNITNTTAIEHDISVVRLRSPLFFGNLIQQGAIIASGFHIPPGLLVNQVGWGAKIPGNFTALSSVPITTVNIDQPVGIQPRILAGRLSGNVTDNGDIGGPWFLGNITVGCRTLGMVLSSKRIVGGHPTSIEHHPSMVQVELLSQITFTWSQNCAGCILTSRFIVSAAQCFNEWNLEFPYRRIRAGATYRNRGGSVVYIDRAVKHPSYGTNGLEADVSVVRLLTPLVYSPTIRQGSIVSANFVVPDHTRVVLAGWGRIAEAGPTSDILREVSVYTINNQLCAGRYATLSWPITVTPNMICSGILDVGGKDACHGDSGGPMYLGHVVIGIISGGYSCANCTFPGISIAVASYTNWILDTVYGWH